MTGARKLAPPADRRSWHRTVRGRLVAAFIPAAALTVIATMLALVQFHNIDAVMSRLSRMRSKLRSLRPARASAADAAVSTA